ncbi:pilus assembly protein [Microvirga sp. SRT01]|uniref:Pilus assembly protein n=1 Tax=Sphingomonas longa TaxID=2778730 RepID=A0ABS2DD44_9SPHN|nr:MULTISPECIES: TadE/TadG family type IV pilus assembly protein [Alphaproteobacteria]MBM6578026.1 pilus assembly protein [Sphingomonas sp. BT552]MBR7711067.1 pilus assembly protein [Microvirga sp. SRT01]
MHFGSDRPRAFLVRLAQSRRGNTLAIMAAALIPLCGMIGGGVDVARMYLVKTRLQHACDAGALAGRKAMGGGQWSQSGNMPNTVAQRFFKANIADDAYGSSGMTSAFSETAGKVTGAASAVLPMTLTKVIGATTTTLSVTCEAEMRLPNTDVMFVLDNTGSMDSKAVSTDSQTKMQAMRSAVKCFYEIVARLDTDEDCVGGAPSGGLSDQVQVRFGFVPYAMNVNVGRLLPTDYIANNWTYQSREVDDDPEYGAFDRWNDTFATNTVGSYGTAIPVQLRGVGSSADCNSSTFPTPADTYTPTSGQRQWPIENSDNGTEWSAYTPTIHRTYSTSYSSSLKICTLRYQERTMFRLAWHKRVSSKAAGAVGFPIFAYRPVRFDISQLKNNPGMANVSLPIGKFNAATSVAWGGCIEERQTVRATSYDPIPGDALDLDLKNAPTGSEETQWGPLLPGAVFGRKNASGVYTTDTIRTFNALPFSRVSECPAAATKMMKWPYANEFSNYVDGLVARGNTYHDIGLIWGARLMWPTGIFRAENEFTPQGGEIQRNLIFMTDGDACTDIDNYQAYGFAAIDRRQTPANTLPTEGCTTTGTLTQQVNARYQAVCRVVRNENITLWVIWFGVKNNTLETQMRNCATPGRFFAARNQTDLQNTFRQIADQISQLRITN